MSNRGVSPETDEKSAPSPSSSQQVCDGVETAAVTFTIGDKYGTEDSLTSEGNTPASKRLDDCDDGDLYDNDRNDYDTVDESCLNPEPPIELAALLDADSIGGTMFSKHWVFSTLMKLLQACFNLFLSRLYAYCKVMLYSVFYKADVVVPCRTCN